MQNFQIFLLKYITEKDIAECIMERLSDGSKTRGQIIRELKKQNLIGSAKELKRKQPG